MKTLLFLLFLIIFHCGHAVVILQSTTATTVASPAGQTTIYSTYYNTNQKNFAGSGVQWITSSNTNSQTRFENLFYASCVGSANLTIAAANSFNAYLDGVYIGNGTNHSRVYTFSIKISCGNHNFTVVVYHSGTTNQGLTFAIDQDQSNCYNCQAAGFWNEFTCSCQCITTPCTCTAPKVWKTYPVCGCGCPLIRYLAEDTKAANIAKATEIPIRIFPLCIYPRYYNAATCGCTCHYTYCPPRQYFDQVNCRCYEIIY